MKEMSPLRIAVLVSGSGSNMEFILHYASEKEDCTFVPAVVVSNNAKAGAIEKAKKFNVPVLIAEHKEFKTRKEHEERILELLEPYKPDILVLAGYMRVVTSTLINAFNNKYLSNSEGILNIHPANTFEYQGAHGYEYALGLLPEYPKRLKETKITVHLVDEGVDTGPIIGQRTLIIEDDDTLDSLKERGLELEHEFYSLCINFYCKALQFIRS
jgi:phosphoribosylglycinamide formyltransferase-1